ncbi:MAG: winged helix-turn-helix domain-containing protein [Promethearchaeia archaeon]
MDKISLKKEQMSDLLDLLNKTRFQIYTYLNMYGKLSLTEIAEKLNKSKSTIHEHIKKLKEVNGIIEEKRAIYSDPNSNKPKVFENVYSLNPELSTEFEDFIPGLNPEKPTTDQAKAVINLLLYAIKIRKANLNITQRFFEKVSNNFEKEPEKMINVAKKVIYGLFRPKYEINDVESKITSKDGSETIEFPALSSYLHLSPRQFNMVSEKYTKFCQLFYSEEFIKASSNEKPFIFMVTGIPMKSILEFLNQ